MNLSMLFQIVLYTSVTASIITLGILLVKWSTGNRFSATWNYYIWFLVLLILMIPYIPIKAFNIIEFPILQSQSNIHKNVASNMENKQKSAALQAVTSDNPSTEALEKYDEELPLKQEENKIAALSDKTALSLNYQLLGQIWITGAALALLFILLVYLRQKLKIRILPRCTDGETLSLLEECKKVLKIYTDVIVIYCQDIKSPSVLGFVNYKLLFPKEMMNGLSLEEKRFIFLHELSHLKRKDTLINWISTILLMLYWFNPVIWYAFHQMRQDCEPACDARVLRYMNPSERIKYGEMLLNFIKLFSQPGWVPGSAGIANSSQCRKRIILISDFDKKAKKRSVAAVLLTFLLMFVGLFLQSGNSTALANSFVVDKQAAGTEDFPSAVNTAIEEKPKLSKEETFLLEMPKLGELSVKNKIGNIYVKKTEENNLRLRIVKKVEGVMTEEAKEVLDNIDVSTGLNNGRLEIYAVTKDKKLDFWVWKASEHSTVNLNIDFYVEVPRDFENYAISLEIGNVEVCDQKGVFHIDNKTGKIILNRVEVEKSSYITLNTGEINMESDLKNFVNLDITCNVGKVNLTIPRNSTLNLKANTKIGNIDGNFISSALVNKNMLGASFSKNFNGGKASVNLEVKVGDIRIDGK